MLVYTILVLGAALVILPQCMEGIGSKSIKAFSPFNFLISGIILAVLTVLCVFRGVSVGTDYAMYQALYYQGSTMLQAQGIEKGFLVIYRVAVASGDFKIFSLLSFFIFIAGGLFYIKIHGCDTLQSLAWIVLTYLYFSSFNVVRQMAALGVVMFGLGLLETKIFRMRPIKGYIVYIGIVLVACLFHASAFISIFIPIAMKFKVTPKIVFSGAIITTVMYFTHFLDTVIPRVAVLFPHYAEKYSSNINFYANSTKGLLEFIPIAVQFVILFAIVHKYPQFTRTNASAIAMYFFYLILFSGAGNEPILRLQIYTEYFIVILFERMFAQRLSECKKPSLNVLKFAVLVFFVLYAFLRLGRNVGGVVPYIFS